MFFGTERAKLSPAVRNLRALARFFNAVTERVQEAERILPSRSFLGRQQIFAAPEVCARRCGDLFLPGARAHVTQRDEV